MAIARATPRDKLDQLLAFVRRSRRYWWLIGVAFVVGALLGTALAIKTKRMYESTAVLMYQERIQSSLLQGRDVMTMTKNLSLRYREILMARQQVAKVIEKFGLFPDIVEGKGMDAAVDEFRLHLGFRVRGTDMFHISYETDDPDQAQAVTKMLTDLLEQEDQRIRRESAFATRNFLVDKKTEAEKRLRAREREFSTFLSEHPEFAEETIPGQSAAGAGVRAASEGSKVEVVLNDKGEIDKRLLALERQRQRIKSSLASARSGRSERPARVERTPEVIAAEQALRDAERELGSAERNLASKRALGYKDAHPDVKVAQQRVDVAKRQVDSAKSALEQAKSSVPVPIVTPVDADALAEQLKDLEKQISRRRGEVRKEKAAARGGEADPDEDEPAGGSDADGEEDGNWVVALETRYARLSRAVKESQDEVKTLTDRVFAADLTASQQMAEEAVVLSIVDPANRPSLPKGKSPKLFIALGAMVFAMLGAGLALALALVDDRLYTAGDLDKLQLARVQMVIPRAKKRRRRRQRARRGSDQR